MGGGAGLKLPYLAKWTYFCEMDEMEIFFYETELQNSNLIYLIFLF